MVKKIQIGNVEIGHNGSLVLIAGPCVIEGKTVVFEIADALKQITARLKIPLIFKASYDKANRTSISSFRGEGMKSGLRILKEIKTQFNLPVTSDVHCTEEIDEAAKILDVIQIPAFLCRQTNLLMKAAKTGKVVNVKKGQFLAPWDMKSVVQKLESTGNRQILLTERGVSFGYNNLVTDFRSLAIMREFGYPVILDASHSVQQPGGLGTSTGGNREFIPLLARCGAAAGCDGIFMEVHPSPDKARSDGPNMLPLKQLENLLVDLIAIDTVVKRKKYTTQA